jgi:hypothetical protein
VNGSRCKELYDFQPTLAEGETRGVLKRHPNDSPLVKGSSGTNSLTIGLTGVALSGNSILPASKVSFFVMGSFSKNPQFLNSVKIDIGLTRSLVFIKGFVGRKF